MTQGSATGYAYPMVRGSGAFLVCIGVGLVLAALLRGNAPMNTRIFAVAAVLAVIAIPVARRIHPLGLPPRKHILAMLGALALELLLFSVVFRHLPAGTSVETRWLWALLLVGLHFVPMALALGPRVVVLGIACAAAAGAGLLLPALPFVSVVVVVGLLKAGFGAWLATTRATG